MRLTSSTVSGALVLHLAGSVSADDVPVIQQRVADVAETGSHARVVVEVSGVVRLDPDAVPGLVALLGSEHEPGPLVSVVGARGQARETLAEHAPGVLGQGRVSVDELWDADPFEPRLCAVRRLAPTTSAPRTARRFVRDACAEWRLPPVDEAELVADELVTNAVTHARTESILRLEHWPHYLLVAVRDRGADNFPAWWQGADEGAPARAWGRGLTLVRAVAERAGARAEPLGGKTVWALMRAEPLIGAGRGRPLRLRLLVHAGRRTREDGRWEVVLDLLWRPQRPQSVALMLGSRPRHPAFPGGIWHVAPSTLRDALDGPVRQEQIRIRPERGGRELVVQLPGEPVQVVRVSGARVRALLDQIDVASA